VNYPVNRHSAVDRDIIALAGWIAQDNREAAFRFVEAAEETILSLGEMPGKGSPKHLRSRRLKNVRSWAVSGFPKHLIFYEFRESEVYVLAVLHGARNYSPLLQKRTSV